MNTLFTVENKEMNIIKKFNNQEDAQKAQKQMEMVFGKLFAIKAYKDVYSMNFDK